MTISDKDLSPARLRATYVMEQHLGHRSFYENLRRVTEEMDTVDSHWVPVAYRESTPVWDRMPASALRVRNAAIGRSQVRQGLSGNTADVLFFNTQVPAALAGRIVRSSPYVLCTDMTPRQFDEMSTFYDHRPDGKGPVARYKHAVNTRLFQNASRIAAWSHWVRDSLVDEYTISPAKIEVIPPGIDLDVWRQRPPPSQDRPLRVLFVGGDLVRKGGLHLIEAFRKLPPGIAELHLVTRSPLDGLPDATFVHRGMTPNSTELVELYSQSDVFVLPSQGEAFGIAATEAAATGLPVIGTRVGGLVDIIEEGITGYFVDVGDLEQLTSILARLAENRDLRLRLGVAGRARAERLFDASINAERIAVLLTAAIDDAPTNTDGLSLRRTFRGAVR